MTTDPLTDLKTNALTAATAPLFAALQNIQNNPTQLNVVAQGIALQGALVAAAPTMETLGIKDLAALLEQQLQKFLTGLQTQVAGTATASAPDSAPTPAPAPAPSPAAA